MKATSNLIIILLAIFISGCEKDNTEATTGIIGEWKLVEEKIGSGLTGNPVIFEPVQSNKVIVFFNDGTFSSNGEMCIMSNQASSQNIGSFYESLLSIQPDGCQSTAPTSGIKYQIDADTLIIGYPCYEECQQKYSRI